MQTWAFRKAAVYTTKHVVSEARIRGPRMRWSAKHNGYIEKSTPNSEILDHT